MSHGEGCYYAPPQTIAELEAAGRVLFRYCEPDGRVTVAANPNGSVGNIAGIINEPGNVLGMMPHPERSCEPLLGSDDGNLIFGSMVDAWAGATGALAVDGSPGANAGDGDARDGNARDGDASDGDARDGNASAANARDGNPPAGAAR